ncbi:MAG: hypothetical protein HC772_09455 [Leptolyngbyaceae cyanobacterium CRU_2_3]|nr:hypothetical protein [Leptolyngbyaceae cyanobacterium CRU_2_3]
MKQKVVGDITMTNGLNERMERLEVDMQAVKEVLQKIVAQQDRTQRQISQLVQLQQQTELSVDRLGQRVDNFVVAAQQVIANHGEQIERTESAVSLLADSVSKFNQSVEALLESESQAAGQ